MDLLKKEMERKKKALQVAKKEQGGSKFLKTSELRRIQEEQEDEAREKKRKHNSLVEKTTRGQQQEIVDSSPSSAKKRKRPNQKDGTDTSDKKQPLGDSETKEESKTTTDTVSKKSTSDIESLSSDEVMQRLRALGLPIQMFGETSSHRKTRLKEAMENQKNVMAGLSEMEEFRLGSGHGIRNTFLEREKKGDEMQEDAKVARKQEKEEDGDDDDGNDPVKRIYRFFKGLLRQWEDDLAARPEAVKRTAAGRNETKTLKQVKDYIRPLFKLCKTRRLDPSLMSHILKIVEYCEVGEFVKANDAYIDVAIGRAAWPIGVTQVGIHSRTGRAKIESSNVAHVMNSELQRKYLTSVKRLMTYYQKKREDVAPSKKVLN